MFHVFHLDVAITIQECFNSILYMLQRLDGCCRGDETLGQGKGAAETEHGGGPGRDRDGATARGGARRDRRGARHGGGRSMMGLTPGAQPG
jgi:hypothetical protein